MTPGVILYLLFGVFAFLGGLLLWLLFLKLDSARYPIKLYGDLGQRIFGTWARYLSGFLQAIQLTLNVGLIVGPPSEAPLLSYPLIDALFPM